MRRNGRPGLIGLAARTAVVTGTANAMNARAADRRADQQVARQAYAQSAAQPAAAPAAPGPGSDLTSELTKLADLHAAGVLTAEEFAAAKARLLG